MSSQHHELVFTAERAEVGSIVSEAELVKRLAYQLQIPHTTYGKRLFKVYKAVLEDALLHGESINLGVAIIKLREFNDRIIPEGAFGAGQKRKRMYKYSISVTEDGNEAIEKLTEEKFND